MQEILQLARRDRKAACEALAGETLERQVQLVCETPVPRRARLLDLLPSPERVIPQLPEAELCFTAKAVGLSDAGWILEHATDAQIVASLDLDVWSKDQPDPATLEEWMKALADAGGSTLVRSVRAMDPELLVLAFRARMEVWLRARDDDWTPPDGAQTLDGEFYFRARGPKDDLAEIVLLLRGLFESDYWLYFRMLQGVIWELSSDLEEWALGWRSGRLEDLGFPPRDQAMRIYGYLRPDQRSAVPEAGGALSAEAWRLPVWLPSLPEAADARHSLLRSIAQLSDEERKASFYRVVALANAVAVADRMPLGDVESVPVALDKAARVASLGLDHIAEENGLDATEVLRRVSLERLFRVGASLDPASRPPLASEYEDDEDGRP